MIAIRALGEVGGGGCAVRSFICMGVAFLCGRGQGPGAAAAALPVEALQLDAQVPSGAGQVVDVDARCRGVGAHLVEMTGPSAR